MLFVAVLLALALPATAGVIMRDGKPWVPEGCAQPAYSTADDLRVCVTREGLVRKIGWYTRKPLREDRQVKLTLGFSTNAIGVTTPAGTLGASAGEGGFLEAFWTGVRTWLDSKPGNHRFNVAAGVGPQASFRVLTDNPAAFSEGEQFAFWGSRSPGIQNADSMNISLELRPRLGGEKSRWRLGTQFTAGWRTMNVNTFSAQERLGVTDVTVTPYSPNAVLVTGNMSRSYHTEQFSTHLGAWHLSLGPEYELLHEGLVDLSVEAGYAFFNYSRRSNSDLYQSSYLLFVPELFVPDEDPARLREGGETPLTDNSHANHNRHRVYLGVRAEVYPFQRRLGLGVGVRWYSGNLPFTHTFTPAQFGSFDESARARNWVASASLTLGFPFNNGE